MNEEQVNEALSHSNIDEMAKAQAQAQMQEQNPADTPASNDSNAYIQQSNDSKILKLATFAIVLKHLPPDKRQGLLNKFSPQDAAILAYYASMDDFENKLDKGLVAKCLNEIKKNLPEPRKINKGRIYDRIYKIVKNSNISKISNMMIRERIFVKEFVSSAGKQRNSKSTTCTRELQTDLYLKKTVLKYGYVIDTIRGAISRYILIGKWI